MTDGTGPGVQSGSGDLRGKVAWVTGASRGLGRAVAVALAEAGARVAVTARGKADLCELQQELGGNDVLVLPGSVSDPAQVDGIVARIVDGFGALDVLVHSAGISPIFKPTVDVTDEEWRNLLDVNLTGAFNCCRSAGRVMVERGRGSIVAVSSVHGSVGLGRLAPYAAAKGGIEMLVRVLALEWASSGVRVNSLAPGYFESRLSEPLLQSRRGREIVGSIPLGRVATTDELVGAALFLAGGASSYVTGTTLFVDGGFTAH